MGSTFYRDLIELVDNYKGVRWVGCCNGDSASDVLARFYASNGETIHIQGVLAVFARLKCRPL
jgi:hypothetical protein